MPLPQWQALAAHAAQMRQRHLRDLFAADPQRFEKLSRTELNLLFDFSRQRLDARDAALADRARAGARPRQADRGDVRRREDQHHRESRRPARRPAQPRGPPDPRRRPGRDARSAREPRQDAQLRRRRARRTHSRRDRQDVHGHREHRHRRLGPRHRDGDRGAREVSQPQSASALRFEHRRRAARRRAREGRSRAHAVRRVLEDVHDAGDAHQREARAPVDRRSVGRGRAGAALRRSLDQRQGDGRFPDPAAEPLHDVGLGRRPLFGVVGGRTVGRAGARHGSVRADARRRSRDGRALRERAVRAATCRC